MRLEPQRTRRGVVPVFLIIIFLIAGCVSGRAGTFGVISTRATGAKVEVIAYRVEGWSCPSGFGSYGAYSAAVESALRRVPEADVLVNAHFYAQDHWPGRVCTRVVGDAARLAP